MKSFSYLNHIEEIDKRNKKILDLRVNKKMYLDEIGVMFGITKERVRQIVKKEQDKIKTLDKIKK